MAEYKTLEEINSGTFSVVYKAENSLEKSRVVALKKIISTSSPDRVIKEIKMLQELNGEHNVVKCLDVYRIKSGINIVMPFFEHDDFKNYFTKISEGYLKGYMRNLLTALKHVHSKGIIHRDLKPSNFLHKFNSSDFLLIDFGLSQYEYKEETKKLCKNRSQSSSPKSVFTQQSPSTPGTSGFDKNLNIVDKKDNKDSSPPNKKLKSMPFHVIKKELENKLNYFNLKPHTKSHLINGKKKPYNSLLKPKRKLPAVQRCGTRGFRPPEVLLRLKEQTCAIDIWAAGVIMLCIVTRRYPLFYSPDDMTALGELICIFGLKKINLVSKKYGRKITAEIGVSDKDDYDLITICKKIIVKNEKEEFPWSMACIQFLEKLLNLDPEFRVTAEEALKDEFLN